MTDHKCHHRNVTGTFDDAGRHLSNRCDDCGYTVTWAAADTGEAVVVDTSSLNRVMDLGVTARLAPQPVVVCDDGSWCAHADDAERGNRLTRENVQTILDRYIAHCKIDYHVTPHGLRRTHAKTAAEQGEDLLGIAESLRHSDSRTTRTSYIGLDSGRGALTRQRVSSVYAQMSG